MRPARMDRRWALIATEPLEPAEPAGGVRGTHRALAHPTARREVDGKREKFAIGTGTE